MAKQKKCFNDKKAQDRREEVKLRVTKYREELKNNPEKYEAKRLEKERYQRRKAQGKIKSTNELTPREQRKLRKNWRTRSKKSYNKKMARLKTVHPPAVCENDIQVSTQEMDGPS